MVQRNIGTALRTSRRIVVVGLVLVVAGVWWWLISPSEPSPHLSLVEPHMFHPLTPDDFGMLVYLRVHFVRVGRFLGPFVALGGALLIVVRGFMKARAEGGSLGTNRQ